MQTNLCIYFKLWDEQLNCDNCGLLLVLVVTLNFSCRESLSSLKKGCCLKNSLVEILSLMELGVYLDLKLACIVIFSSFSFICLPEGFDYIACKLRFLIHK